MAPTPRPPPEILSQIRTEVFENSQREFAAKLRWARETQCRLEGGRRALGLGPKHYRALQALRAAPGAATERFRALLAELGQAIPAARAGLRRHLRRPAGHTTLELPSEAPGAPLEAFSAAPQAVTPGELAEAVRAALPTAQQVAVEVRAALAPAPTAGEVAVAVLAGLPVAPVAAAPREVAEAVRAALPTAQQVAAEVRAALAPAPTAGEVADAVQARTGTPAQVAAAVLAVLPSAQQVAAEVKAALAPPRRAPAPRWRALLRSPVAACLALVALLGAACVAVRSSSATDDPGIVYAGSVEPAEPVTTDAGLVSGAAMGVRQGRRVPLDKLIKGQKAGPCDTDAGEHLLGSGCWLQMGETAPCPRLAWESAGKCYRPIAEDPRHPVSEQPADAGFGADDSER